MGKDQKIISEAPFIQEPIRLGNTLSLWAGICLIVGNIIGTGVFSTGGKILELVGSPGMAMIVWLIGAFVSFVGGLSYTEWGMSIPESGGDIPYLEYVYPNPKQFFSFLYTWCRVLLVHTGYSAALCTVVGSFTLVAFPIAGIDNVQKDWIQKGISCFAVLIIFFMTAFSNKCATMGMQVLTILQISIVSFVVICGIAHAAGAFPSVPNPNNFASPFKGTSTSPSAYASALFKIFFCYEGWGSLASSIGELKNPKKNIPRAIITGLTIVATLYISANISYFMVLPADEISKLGEDLAAVFFERLLGEIFAKKVLTLLMLISAFGCAFSTTFGASRVALVAAERDFLPFSNVLKRLHPKFSTPFNCLVLHSMLTMFFIVVPPGEEAFFFLIDMTAYPTWVFYMITLSGLIILRFREPNMERGFKVWLACPAIVIATSIFLSIFPFIQGGTTAIAAAIGLGSIILGIPVYYFKVYKRLENGAAKSA